jgi:hypothetical protein
MSYFPEMEYKGVEEDEAIDLPASATSLDLLRAVYRNARLPLHARMRAAALALPHEHPQARSTSECGWDRVRGAAGRGDQAIP